MAQRANRPQSVHRQNRWNLEPSPQDPEPRTREPTGQLTNRAVSFIILSLNARAQAGNCVLCQLVEWFIGQMGKTFSGVNWLIR